MNRSDNAARDTVDGLQCAALHKSCLCVDKFESCGRLGISVYRLFNLRFSQFTDNTGSWFFPPILIGLFPAAVDLSVRGTFTRGTALVWGINEVGRTVGHCESPEKSLN